MLRFVGPLLLLFVALLVPSGAGAWIQTTTCINEEPPAPTTIPWCQGDALPRAVQWGFPEVEYVVHREGTDDFPTGDGQIDPDLLATVQTSMATWNEPDCSPFQFVFGGLTDIDEFHAEDGSNVIVFHDDGEWPYASAALAFTAVSFRRDDPFIVNADMELNSDANEFVFVEEGDGDGWDVQNTVTHEAGHMLGLAHTPVQEATMQYNAEPGETRKRDLHQDDIDGLCTIYPPGSDEVPRPEPDPDPNGCCAVAANSPERGGLFAALAVLIALLAGRRRALR